MNLWILGYFRSILIFPSCWNRVEQIWTSHSAFTCAVLQILDDLGSGCKLGILSMCWFWQTPKDRITIFPSVWVVLWCLNTWWVLVKERPHRIAGHEQGPWIAFHVEDYRRVCFPETRIKMENHSAVDQFQIGDAHVPREKQLNMESSWTSYSSLLLAWACPHRMVNLTLETSMWATPRSWRLALRRPVLRSQDFQIVPICSDPPMRLLDDYWMIIGMIISPKSETLNPTETLGPMAVSSTSGCSSHVHLARCCRTTPPDYLVDLLVAFYWEFKAQKHSRKIQRTC